MSAQCGCAVLSHCLCPLRGCVHDGLVRATGGFVSVIFSVFTVVLARGGGGGDGGASLPRSRHLKPAACGRWDHPSALPHPPQVGAVWCAFSDCASRHEQAAPMVTLWYVLRVYLDPEIDSYCCRTIAELLQLRQKKKQAAPMVTRAA